MWNQNLTNLNYLLAGFYPFKNDSLPVAKKATLNILNIAFNDKPVTNWFNILDEADKEDKINNLVEAVLEDYPDNPVLKAVLEGTPLTDKTIGKRPAGKILDTQDLWKDPDEEGGDHYE